MHPVDALRRTAFLLEREQASTPRVKAFRTAAAVLGGLGDDELQRRLDDGTLTGLRGVGPRTAQVAAEAAAGQVPGYLAALEERHGPGGDSHELVEVDDATAALLAALRGDLHTHSDWSDGGSPPQEMALTAVELGHEHLALTDHSGGLRVANGLSPRRLERQLDLVAALAPQLAPFRLLSGIEVDITEDGGLDCPDELLGRVDVVVASVHSRLGGRSTSAEMTARMLGALEHPRVRVLGHCTGRLVAGGADTHRPPKRPEAPFDAAAVFARCAERGVAVEVNARPERLDPPMRLLRQALDAGCLLSIDTDAHAPGQLDWRVFGAARVAAAGVVGDGVDRVVTTWPLDRLLRWLQTGVSAG